MELFEGKDCANDTFSVVAPSYDYTEIGSEQKSGSYRIVNGENGRDDNL